MKINRIVYFGTPDFAVTPLQTLIQHQKTISLVVTQPDKPTGRGKKMASPAVKVFCDQNKIECIQPTSVKTPEFLDLLKKQNADLFVVAAFGRILPQKIMDTALTLNIHASLLPRWRGASPIAQSILHGDSFAGVSIMKIVKELDAGPFMLQKKIPIDQSDDTETLTQKLSAVGSDALMEAIELLESGKAEFIDQDQRQVTFAPLLDVEAAQIDWKKTAKEIQQHIRAYGPNPGAYTSDGVERIKIFKSTLTLEKTDQEPGTLLRKKKQLLVSANDHWLDILEVQRPGKKKQGIVDFLNGYSMERTTWA